MAERIGVGAQEADPLGRRLQRAAGVEVALAALLPGLPRGPGGGQVGIERPARVGQLLSNVSMPSAAPARTLGRSPMPSR